MQSNPHMTSYSHWGMHVDINYIGNFPLKSSLPLTAEEEAVREADYQWRLARTERFKRSLAEGITERELARKERITVSGLRMLIERYQSKGLM